LRLERVRKDEQRVLGLVPVAGKFHTLIFDPAWQYDWLSLAGRAKPGYAMQSLKQLHALDVMQWAESECHLYLWTTNNFMNEACKLGRATVPPARNNAPAAISRPRARGLAQRRAWRNLALVLINLPFAFVGGVFAVALTGGLLSLGSMVGFVTLFGITLRNSMLMISHYEHLVVFEKSPSATPMAMRSPMYTARMSPVVIVRPRTCLP
jgi:hypothetical protein